MRKRFTAQEKFYAVQDYLNGKGSQKSIAKALGTKASVIQRGITNYQSMRSVAF